MDRKLNDAQKQALVEKLRLENEAFFAVARSCLKELFEKARQKNQLHFCFSLNPEFRGCQGPGFSSTEECFVAINEYISYLQDERNTGRIKIRIGLMFYCHLSEASGFYEVPKNMLRVVEGKPHILWPFKDIVETHRTTGEKIAPNANKVMKDLAGHSADLGLMQLAETFKNLFDADLRNGFAHADYVVWPEGILLTKRNGGEKQFITYERFNHLLNRAVNFFSILHEVIHESVESYDPPKTFRGKLGDAPEGDCTVSFLPSSGEFSIRCG